MPKRITIKDIAHETGVSVTTVAKALNNQNRISDETRQMILQTAKQMGYTPNRSARAMACREMTLAVIYPAAPGEFISYIERGFQRGAEELADFRVDMKLMRYSDLRASGQINDYLRQLAVSPKKVHGLVFFAGRYEEQYQDRLRHIIELGIPVLHLVTECGLPEALGIIRLHAEVAGAMAAQFLQMTVPAGRPAAILVGDKDLKVHSRCIDGFMRQAGLMKLPAVGVYETHDDKETAYRLTGRLIAEHPDLGGIYVSSYNSVGVCEWFEDHQQQGIKIIGHDLYPALVQKLEAGALSATLFQNQYEFGRLSLHYLYQYLTGSRKREDCTKLMKPQLVMQSNLACYRDSF